jgi:hypothetical protein
MAVGDRTRRRLPAVLVSLVLLLGLCAGVDSSFSASGVRLAGSAPAAFPAIDTHSTPGTQPRASGHRHAGDTTPLAAAPPVAVRLRGPAFRWPGPRGTVAGPASDGRFTRDSRAPPHREVP